MSFNLIVEPKINKKGNIANSVALYDPDERERKRLQDIRKEYQIADTIHNQSYEEFNNRSLIEQQDKNQKSFNNFISEGSNNPDEDWHANTRRSVTRNKVISIAAHITSAILEPKVFAQNENDEEDDDAADTMQDIMKWSLEQSDYSRKFVNAVIAALVNPGVFIYEGFADVKRKIKEITSKGSWTDKEVQDEIFSGFQNLLVPLDELYIGDVYEPDIQKQPFMIWRRIIDYTNAKIKYEGNENFDKYVRPGLRVFYDEANDTFYESYDVNLEGRLVEEIIYYNRYADLEIRLVNGVLMDDSDRPLQRKDKCYPFVFSGYEPYDEGRFFYRKSLVEKMESDQDIIDRLYNMILDGTFLSVMPPLITFGEDEVSIDVIMPGRITSMTADNKLEPINIGTNLNAGITALEKVESSLSESSQDPMHSGQAMRGSQTAFEIARLEENARKMLGLFGKMIGFLVKDFGQLRLSTIVQHLTVGDAIQTQGSINRLKFRKILIPDSMAEGKKVTKRIEFDNEDVDEYELLKREEYPDGNKQKEPKENLRIIKINPKLFRQLKYLVKIEPDFETMTSTNAKKAMNIEAYDRLIQNPMAEQEAVLRDFLLGNYKKGEEDKYIRKPQPMAQPGMQGMPQEGAEQSNLIKQLTQPKQTEVASEMVS